MENKLPIYYYWLPLMLLCTFYLYQSLGFEVHDFANYYFAAKFMAEGNFNFWVYFPYEFNSAIAATGQTGIFASFAPNTPFVALLFTPFSLLPIAIAKLVFNTISVLLFLRTLRRLIAYYKIEPVYLLGIAALLFLPIRNQILFGQLYFVLFFFMGETWLAYKKGKKIKTAIYLALAVMLKVFPLLLAFVFVFRKKYEILGYFAACLIAAVLLSSSFCGIDLWSFYVQSILMRASNGEIATEYVLNYQSIWMFLKTLLITDNSLNPDGLVYAPVLFLALMWTVKIAVLAVGYDVSRKCKMPLVVLSYWIIAMILLSPYGSTYTNVLLIFPYLALALNPISLPKKAIGFAILLMVCNLPVSLLQMLHFPLNYLRFYALLVLFVLWYNLISRKIRYKRVAVSAALPFFIILVFRHEDAVVSEHVLGHDAPILVYDLKVEKNQLVYYYYDKGGEKSTSIPLTAHNIEAAQRFGGQIFWKGEPLTQHQSHKRKPQLVDNKTLYYLDDVGRGIGFYAIRKIDLNRNNGAASKLTHKK